jgi:hypothetical protein
MLRDYDLRQRVLSKIRLVECRTPDVVGDCWEWIGARQGDRYGLITVRNGKKSGITKMAHRLSYELFVGPIPNGAQILHRCDFMPCIQPLHLFPGTHQENMDDKVRKGRQSFIGPGRTLRGAENSAAILTQEQVDRMRLLRTNGWTLEKLAIEFTISSSQVSNICRGVSWKPKSNWVSAE